MDDPAAPPLKRLRLSEGSPSKPDAMTLRLQRSAFLSSFSRPISPPSPPSRQRYDRGSTRNSSNGSTPSEAVDLTSSSPIKPFSHSIHSNESPADKTKLIIPSPFHLTRSHDLPDSANIDTVTIHELLGSPLIKEAWIFNYCHDVDWTMEQFDRDVRDNITVKIISGGKAHIDQACARYSNVEALTAYLPDPFGTHHTKMIILFRHDDLAQIIIHTANMLPCDWHNATQAAWCSPLLPLVAKDFIPSTAPGRIGTGARFKQDLEAYLGAYGNRLKGLIASLNKYDFSEVRGALIGSVPSKRPPAANSLSVKTWGHVALARALKAIPVAATDTKPKSSSKPLIIAQVSSIASFTQTWLSDTLFKALCPTPTINARFSIIFPTLEEVRLSLDGYGCGGSIHCKTQSAAHKKQIDFLRPHLCHWASSLPDGSTGAQRASIMPHIKTYMRLSASPAGGIQTPKIEWALLTSANLSTQAWGTAPRAASKKDRDDGLPGEIVHIQSYELGVLVWPSLWAQDGREAEMVPCFGRDVPASMNGAGRTLDSGLEPGPEKVVVGLRMPFDLPLKPYGRHEDPWSPGGVYGSPDRHGYTWPIQHE